MWPELSTSSTLFYTRTSTRYAAEVKVLYSFKCVSHRELRASQDSPRAACAPASRCAGRDAARRCKISAGEMQSGAGEMQSGAEAGGAHHAAHDDVGDEPRALERLIGHRRGEARAQPCFDGPPLVPAGHVWRAKHELARDKRATWTSSCTTAVASGARRAAKNLTISMHNFSSTHTQHPKTMRQR